MRNMDNVIWVYPSIKNLALERYDKEFVLDYAPRCYAETKDLQSFFEMMDGYLSSLRERSQRKILRLKLIDLMNLKTKLLETENLKEDEMAKQNYELVAELRDIERTLLKEIVDFSNEIDTLKNYSNNREFQKLIKRIAEEIKIS
jgi:hypothetical protein